MRGLTAFIITLFLALMATGCEREDLSYDKEEPKKEETKKENPKDGSGKDTSGQDPDNPGNPDDPNNPDDPDDPNNPDEPPAPDPVWQSLAAQVNGDWEGKLSSSYYDDFGELKSGEYTTLMQFVLTEEGGIGGTGRETDYDAEGRRVWRMAFTWAVTGDQQLSYTTSEGAVYVTKSCHVDDSSLVATFERNDGRETAKYELKKKK